MMESEFHSDDEDSASFMSGKKKGSAKKKGKTGQLFRIDKKDKGVFNDLHSPVGLKQKHSVHGVVGPADYFDQPTTTSSIVVTTHYQSQQVQSSVTTAVDLVQTNQQPWKSTQSPMVPQPTFPPTTAVIPMPTFPTQPVGSFQPNFPPVTTVSTKIERPHSSAALLQERQPPQSPTPFKQPVNTTPQKQTLLSMASNTFQKNSGVVVPQLTHQRSHSYSRAMSVPIISRQDINGVPFNPHFENTIEGTATDFHPGSPIQEVATPTQDSVDGPLSTPRLESTNEELWTPTVGGSPISHHDSTANWTNFSTSSSPQDNRATVDEDESLADRKSHDVESLAESIPDSTSSIEDDIDESVWKINEEQHDYYTNQFNNIKPSDSDVIGGVQARDFFLKSNLPTEILSKIWHLSDLDQDSALNLDEFCIAMHLVVAVRHGVELPSVLPESLLPNQQADPFDDSVGISREELIRRHSDAADQKHGEADQWSADFESFNKDNTPPDSTTEAPLQDAVQTMGQPSSVAVTTIPMESRVQPVSLPQPGSPSLQQRHNKQMSTSATAVDQISRVESIQQTPVSPKLRHHSASSARESANAGTAIARPRASGNKNVNLMDAQPWQLLPPPSLKTKPSSIKRILPLEGEMSSNASLSSVGSTENTTGTLVSIDRSTEDILGVRPLNVTDDSDGETDRLRVKHVQVRNLSKEKSRSIDSLRSDISESSEYSLRRLSRRDSRPRSFTGSSINDGTAPQEKVKEFETPPVPPPRNKGHARASSLDLNQLFGAKTSLSTPGLSGQQQLLQHKDGHGPTSLPPQKPPRTSAPNKVLKKNPAAASTDSPYIHPKSAELNTNAHRRSFSLEPGVLAPPPKKSTDGNVIRSGGSIGLVARTEATQRIGKDATQPQSSTDLSAQTKEQNFVRFAEQPVEILKEPKSPIEKKMRKHEVQARIRQLRNENTTLSTLISQLDMEWKEVSEERISLDVRLQKLKQQELE